MTIIGRGTSDPERDRLIGGGELVAKSSAVDATGRLRLEPIHDLVFRPTRPVPHEDGHVTEVIRANWDIAGGPVVQVHITTTLPGRIRAGACTKEAPTACSSPQGW